MMIFDWLVIPIGWTSKPQLIGERFAFLQRFVPSRPLFLESLESFSLRRLLPRDQSIDRLVQPAHIVLQALTRLLVLGCPCGLRYIDEPTLVVGVIFRDALVGINQPLRSISLNVRYDLAVCPAVATANLVKNRIRIGY